MDESTAHVDFLDSSEHEDQALQPFLPGKAPQLATREKL
ncbi:hypothetical protein DSM3645_27336 [Blastopirellula marina DSM 3645]|uniref:Uncharacterized protein n=1 Tax=Blastopirellula marina DSM 3645 TaxID=314230 RepID=A4A017_9BACT|nr:hypothetical protein DSM3645_27336 [Blastopirellula marina DSM 3645]